MTLEEKLERSTIDICLFSPFLARAINQLQMVPIADDSMPTMATDGRKCYFNPAWVESLTLVELEAVRVHECLHVILGHHLRMQDRQPLPWNVAADYALNPLVEEAGYTLPKDALLNSAFSGLSAEEIYAKLPTMKVAFNSTAADKNAASWGQVLPASGGSAAELEAEWRSLAQSCTWGKLPAQLSRALNEEIEPKPKLADMLVPLLTQHFPDDFSWMRPSRRYLASQVVLPSLTGKTGHLAVIVDTSGSIDEKLLKEMLSAVRCLPSIATLTVIYADATVQAVVENPTSIEKIAEAAKGGGGTDFRPAVEFATKLNPTAIVYLTDGYGTFPEAAPSCPFVWVLLRGSEKVAVPFGERIQL